MGLFSHVLVAYDGSAGSERALETAIQLALETGSSLVILSVVEHLPRFAQTMDEVEETVSVQTDALRELQRRALYLAQKRGVARAEALIEVGHAAQQIVDVAERKHTDLLILGRSGHSEVWGRFMGSTADKIVRHAPCSVLIAH